jgi:hypothetical protein
MGQSNSSPEIKRGKSAGSFNLRRELGRRTYESTADGDLMLPPGAVRTDSVNRGLRSSASVDSERTRERRGSLEAISASGSTTMANASAYSSTRLLHAPRLRLNSAADGGDNPGLKERRNSITAHNQAHLRLVLNMDDDEVEAIGRGSKIYSATSAGFKPVTANGRLRRNSSNSIFLTQTADNILDQKALVKCISAAIHAAIEDAPGRVTQQYRMFMDADNRCFTRPTFREVYRFVNNIFMKAQLEAEVLIISLVYVERLRLVMESQLVVGYRNWRAIVLACCVLASKVWDDLSMINADFSTIMAKQFTLKQINELEVAMLSALKFDVKVSLSTYALYYFKMRAMVGPGNLFPDGAAPLSIREAQKMKTLSPSYTKRLSITDEGRRRTSTIGTNEGERARQVSTAALEHIVRQSPKSRQQRAGGQGGGDDEYGGHGYGLEVRSANGAPKRVSSVGGGASGGNSSNSGSDTAEGLESATTSGDETPSDGEEPAGQPQLQPMAAAAGYSATAAAAAATTTTTTVPVAQPQQGADAPATTVASTVAAAATTAAADKSSSSSSNNNSNSSGGDTVAAANVKPLVRRRRRERRPELGVVEEDPNVFEQEAKQHCVEL